DELNGDLADTLTGGHDGESMLARLERANGLVPQAGPARTSTLYHTQATGRGPPVGPGRNSYRYHRLFADLLRYELRREAPGQVPRLHRRAAGWYAAPGHERAPLRAG